MYPRMYILSILVKPISLHFPLLRFTIQFAANFLQFNFQLGLFFIFSENELCLPLVLRLLRQIL